MGSALGAAALVIGHLASAPAPASATPTVLPLRTIGEAANDYPNGAACLSRIAIDATFGALCSDVCVLDANCPTGWGCKSIPQGNGTDIGICFPRRIN